MLDRQTMIIKDTTEKHTTVLEPANDDAEIAKSTAILHSAEDGLDLEPSAFDRSAKTIDYIVQQILPNIPHLISVPTKTPYVRDFPNENLNTPFEEWEVQNLQHMTLVSNGSRGVAWARGDWQDDINTSPYNGFRSGTATPRSERDANKIRTKMSLADYKAGASRRATNTSQPSHSSSSQIVPNGQKSVLKESISPTQQMIDQIIENNISKSLPRFSDDHSINAARPSRPEPSSVSDPPHPKPMLKLQRQADEGRAVRPPTNRPDWKPPQQHLDESVGSHAEPKRSDHSIMPSHLQSPSNQQKQVKPEVNRQKLEKKASRKTIGDQPLLNPPDISDPKQSHHSEYPSASSDSGGIMASRHRNIQNVIGLVSVVPEEVLLNLNELSSSKTPQREHPAHMEPISTDLNASKLVNAMPPLLSPLPAALISPDRPSIEGNLAPESSKSTSATTSTSENLKAADVEATEQSQNEIVSPSESPFEMPRLLSPLPEWWMKKMDMDDKMLRRIEQELGNSGTATLGARHERSRQPDAPGVARKTPKPIKSKSGSVKDPTAAGSPSAKASENIAKLSKTLEIKEQAKLIVKLKYGKRNNKRITRLLQMQARPAHDTRSVPIPAKITAASGIRKVARSNENTEEPSIKRSKISKSDPPPSSLESDAKKHSRQLVNAEDSSSKTPKAPHKDAPAPTSSGFYSKKHSHPEEEMGEYANKRPKVSGNVDVQRARTPLTPNPQSPAPSTSQNKFNTPKRGDAMKSVAMRKVDSNEGQVLTPHGGTVSTPASADKPRTVSSDGKSVETDASKGVFDKLVAIGTTLKRKADQILKVKEIDPTPISDEEKRLGAVTSIEAAVAYMVAYSSKNHKEHLFNLIKNWTSLLPLMVVVTQRAKGQGELFTLALLLNWITRESLERLYMDRIAVDHAGSSAAHLQEIVINFKARQQAISAYREQCKEHPVTFTFSIDEAKDVAVNVLSNFCQKYDVQWESQLEL